MPKRLENYPILIHQKRKTPQDRLDFKNICLSQKVCTDFKNSISHRIYHEPLFSIKVEIFSQMHCTALHIWCSHSHPGLIDWHTVCGLQVDPEIRRWRKDLPAESVAEAKSVIEKFESSRDETRNLRDLYQVYREQIRRLERAWRRGEDNIGSEETPQGEHCEESMGCPEKSSWSALPKSFSERNGAFRDWVQCGVLVAFCQGCFSAVDI